ncbi:MAG: GAF domain-containing protein [Chloroflexi bacterium]|nr:MAG: GAF domain-containing protein [Chloroflexota bacterium]
MATPQKDQKILIIHDDAQTNHLLERLLHSAGYTVGVFTNLASSQKELDKAQPQLVILGQLQDNPNGLTEAEKIIHQYPAVPVLLFVTQDSPALLKEALRLGVSDYLCPPLRSDDLLRAVESSLEKARRNREWVLLESRRATGHLRQRVDELETLSRLGQSITAQLDTDNLLTAIVEAAVELTGAEEGSLLLIDKETGQLYIRASKNFQEDFVRTFRLPIQDTLAGSVLTTGMPVVVDENTPKKIKTSYLVHSLIYVPLLLKSRVTGVLGVDNRNNRLPFQKHDIDLLTTLAEYAVIALLNADQFTETRAERNKLETILRKVQDGVIVVDRERQILMINQAAEIALGIIAGEAVGKLASEIVPQPEILALLEANTGSLSTRNEFTSVDNHVFSAQFSSIPEVGAVITLHDISYLRNLDRMKNEFVGTVSHDLRSPLTAILGYAELVERAGPVNELQSEFIRRVESSVTNISHLVDDLVNLGRIQTGFDGRSEVFELTNCLNSVVDSYQKALTSRDNLFEMQLPAHIPSYYGNPLQIRRMFENILDNCIKYSHPGGKIQVKGKIEQSQVILQFMDEGSGIPAKDLPYVFDKFFRGSNNTSEQTGTGLGLAIVKSVAEAHGGRVWIDSVLNQGTTLTVVLPIQEPPAAG